MSPRSIDRGPIEASGRTRTRSHAARLRDQLIAAPLKPHTAPELAGLTGSGLRDQLIAAPLKPFCGDSGQELDGCLRDQLIAAPLKRSCSGHAGDLIIRSPRSIDRGPIEAPPARPTPGENRCLRDQLIAAPLKPAGRVLPPAGHPRLRDQLIAAPLKPEASTGSIGPRDSLRDQLIAAPLKLEEQSEEFYRPLRLRDQLIAAPLKHLLRSSMGPSRSTSPRSIDRGPIEAPSVQRCA